GLQALAGELLAGEGTPARMAVGEMLQIPIVVGRADDRSHHFGDGARAIAQRNSRHHAHRRVPPVALVRAGRCASNSSKIRRYSSVHESGRTKPWFSTG